jgi:hypothetical protein
VTFRSRLVPEGNPVTQDSCSVGNYNLDSGSHLIGEFYVASVRESFPV